ncbi:MAG: carboxypeptidase-like regulatory domain-containing protein [Myxococcota bacterium]
MLSLVFASTAAAVPITGSLRVPSNLAPETPPRDAPTSPNWERPNGVVDTRPPRIDVRREMAVVLVGDLTAGERPASNFQLHGGALQPSTMVAQQGTTLRIENTDACSHELQSEAIEGFAPLTTAPGNARTVPIPETGSFEVTDRLYGHVQGHLHVVSNLVARATVGADGRFRFADVPPGTYTLKAFYRAHEVASREITVEDGREFALEEPVALSLPEAD